MTTESATRGEPRPRLSLDWRRAGWLLLAVAIAMRVNNALRYRTGLGFDAAENIAYIRLLLRSWTLPAPDASWSTAHPPLFYYICAGIGRLLGLFSGEHLVLYAVPLLVSAAGVAMALLAVALVRRADPQNERRAVLAGALLLFLPVGIYMSAMVNEEMLAALLTSLVLFGALASTGAARDRPLAHAAGLGALAGLGLLTKLSGSLVVAALAGAWLIAGWRRRRWRRELARVCVLIALALALGGWFYLRNLLEYGYLYPQDLALHALMFEMPPGERGPLDYLRIPLATWTHPQLLHPDLLRSVWGSTYATVWFDGHRHFLANSVAALQAGRVLLVLALLPTLAFAVGLGRGLRRCLREPDGPDCAMLLLVFFTVAGYVLFTYGNPWFATLKGSYLLGLGLPFAFYTSEVLASWTDRRGALSTGVWVILAALLLAVVVTFTIGPIFTKLDGAGLPWRSMVPAG